MCILQTTVLLTVRVEGRVYSASNGLQRQLANSFSKGNGAPVEAKVLDAIARYYDHWRDRPHGSKPKAAQL